MIKRKIDKEFECFHARRRKEALLIDGARQVGKTFSIREYGKRHFEHTLEIKPGVRNAYLNTPVLSS